MKSKRSHRMMQASEGEQIVYANTNPSDTLLKIKQEKEQKGLATSWGDEKQLIVHIPPDREVHYVPKVRGVQEIYYRFDEVECDICGYIGSDVAIYSGDNFETALCEDHFKESDLELE